MHNKKTHSIFKMLTWRCAKMSCLTLVLFSHKVCWKTVYGSIMIVPFMHPCYGETHFSKNHGEINATCLRNLPLVWRSCLIHRKLLILQCPCENHARVVTTYSPHWANKSLKVSLTHFMSLVFSCTP